MTVEITENGFVKVDNTRPNEAADWYYLTTDDDLSIWADLYAHREVYMRTEYSELRFQLEDWEALKKAGDMAVELAKAKNAKAKE